MPPVNRNKPTRAKSSESQYSLMEFMREFPDDGTCLNWLWRTRYSKDGTHADCPRCKAKGQVFKRYQTAQRRQSWTCNGCGYHLHPTAGTIFHKSSTSLHLWFYAMYLMTSTRCGISAKQLERELGVTYKTAWRMAHLIRKQLMADDGEPLTGGQVEVDETYMGGVRSGQKRGGRPPGNDGKKAAVLGMVERKGRVVATTIPNAKASTLLPRIQERVLPESTVYTDEWKAYNRLGKKNSGYTHRRIKHKERIYVSGDVHTNTIEGFWSLTKRGIAGVYHAVSSKHLQGYLNEHQWRYNQRHEKTRSQFSSLLLRAVRS